MFQIGFANHFPVLIIEERKFILKELQVVG